MFGKIIYADFFKIKTNFVHSGNFKDLIDLLIRE